MDTTAKLSVNGIYTMFTREGDKDVVLSMAHNAFQKTGKAAIVNALASGQPLGFVAFLYTSNSGSQTIGASSGTVTWGDFVTKGSASGNGLILAPAYMTGTTEILGQGGTTENMVNSASFVALTDPATKIAGNTLATGNKAFAIGLVQGAVGGGNPILYAAADITPITKAANSQVGVRWTTTITID